MRAAITLGRPPEVVRYSARCERCQHEWIIDKKFGEEEPSDGS
jgi:predicted Zn-ribbon and HTH transcriptional regulator